MIDLILWELAPELPKIEALSNLRVQRIPLRNEWCILFFYFVVL